MASTHAYLSALVPLWTPNRHDISVEVIVKAETYGLPVESGWHGDYWTASFRYGNVTVNPHTLQTFGRYLNQMAKSVAREVDEDHLSCFGMMAMVACLLHSDSFPTWSGNLYIEPQFTKRGVSRSKCLSHYLVTEAPGLDSGTWDRDPVPETDR